jgi:hypothetical protein
MTEARLLLVVEDAFAVRGRDVTVSPRITVQDPSRTPFAVRLRLPTGEERVATAALEVAHIQGPLPPYAMVRLIATTVETVPLGTEIWTLD